MDSTKHIRQHIEEEFDELYGKVFGYLRIRIPRDEDAEDVAAEVFTKAWKRARSYNAEYGTVSMWLFGIARHEAATYWKNHSITQIDYDTVAHVLHDEGKRVARENDEIDLDRFIQGLSEEQRTLIIRHYLDGISHAEIARGIGRTESAVRKTVSRAMRALKDIVLSQ
jgi:RNA polymerase sigma-70 factor (ECF subfamily)